MSQTHGGPGRGSTPSTPLWVKVFGIITLILVLLFAISLLAGVRHGPGLHAPPGEAGAHIPPSGEHENTGGPGGLAGADEAARAIEVTLST